MSPHWFKTASQISLFTEGIGVTRLATFFIAQRAITIERGPMSRHMGQAPLAGRERQAGVLPDRVQVSSGREFG